MTVLASGRRWSPAIVLGFALASLLAGLGLFFSRPDVVAMGLPVAIWTAAALRRGSGDQSVSVTLTPAGAAHSDGTLRTDIVVSGKAEIAELVIAQSERRARRVIVPVNGKTLVSQSRALHSGPITAVKASARGFSVDAAALGAPQPVVSIVRDVASTPILLPEVPLPSRLTGMHGDHDGRRLGQGGDFRDIHQFVPGDELRRVDWRATARMARRRGDLLVRRTNTMSDASVVIAMDTADDLGTVVATWGSGDLERSGITSLDLSRQAARSIAEAAIDTGDRVALHVLMHGGRSIRSGAGRRHLARVNAAISATGQAGEDSRFRRTPPVPHGSVIFVLSTFFDGAASDIALTWRASGHRVVAVDILPQLDRTRLSREQQVSLRLVLAERQDVLHDLGGIGVDTITWDGDVAALMRTAARTRR